MTDAPPSRGPWRPVFLSGVVFPGLGQLVTGRPWRALLFAGSSVAILVAVVRRVMHETQRLLPEEPDALLDPSLPFRLVVEVQRANASFFFWATLGIVAIWLASMADAWWTARGGASAAATGRRPSSGRRS